MNRLLPVLFLFSLLWPGSAQETPTSPGVPSLTGLPPSPPLEASLHPVFDSSSRKEAGPFSNFRFRIRYHNETATQAEIEILRPGGITRVPLPTGRDRTVEFTWEHLPQFPARLTQWSDNPAAEAPLITDIPGSTISERGVALSGKETRATFDFSGDFTLMVRFRTRGQGTLAALAPASGKWKPNGKTLFIRGGRLVYDIGWVGALTGKTQVNNGQPHSAVLAVKDRTARLFLDGKLEGERKNFSAPDENSHVFKIGSTSTNFGGDFSNGRIETVQYWKRSLSEPEISQLSLGAETQVNTPDYHWKPTVTVTPELSTFGAEPGYPVSMNLKSADGLEIQEAWVQPLEKTSHRSLVQSWNEESFERGKSIYHSLCVTCHGTAEKEGSIPIALKFHEGAFKHGKDPFRMWQTITKGYGLMMPQPQYSTRQVYNVIHYIREAMVKPANPDQYFQPDSSYLASLPRGLSLKDEKESEQRPPQYELMDFGNYLFWTYQIEPGPLEPGVNMAYKGLAIRLDEGPGGVSKGKVWAVYDLDTLRLAAIYTGDRFVDWKGIAFDGSHGTHTSIVGERRLTTPNAPGWAHPKTGEWEDPRLIGRDGRRFGPLPKDWAHFEGLEIVGDRVVLKYRVGDARISEMPWISWSEDRPRIFRSLQVLPHLDHLRLRETGSASGNPTDPSPPTFEIEPSENRLGVIMDLGYLESGEADPASHNQAGIDPIPPVAGFFSDPENDKDPFPRKYPGTLTTTIQRGADDGPFAVDVLTVPDADANPWQSWMRLTGLDFFEDGKRAAVCTWMGDVWIVSGIDQDEGELQWQRICAGLFQPLGLKIVDGTIHVTCRDMIARLRDRNRDGEIDRIENFNNDHQVTEHFHEFAMGLQSDAQGNFYYAKSARHAKTALVPHHGTLLRVSADGNRTDILASGFRAANGVCLNPDGSFIVTDQEGHWNPKNRINWVRGKGPDEFFGNIFGYTPVTDERDSAMEKPLCWITNAFDRSPSELLWVPEDAAWGPLNGSLLNLSYGYGKIYVVPHEFAGEQPQGGMCQLPIEQFPTGVMRGRFHPGNGQFYGCGMFAWGSNQQQAGGFYRVRYTGKPALLPIGIEAKNDTLTLTFSDPLDRPMANSPENFSIQTWDLERSAQYGSKHFNEKPLSISRAQLQDDGRSVTLTIPELAPTRGMEIRCQVKSASGGNPVERIIHNTIHRLDR